MADPLQQYLLQELHRLYHEYDKTPTRALMAGRGAFDPGQYQTEFDSWDDALEEAGFAQDALDAERYELVERLPKAEQNHVQRLLAADDVKTLFRGQLLAELHRLAFELDKTPTLEEMAEYGRYSGNSYARHFETWNNAVRTIGLEPHDETKRLSKAELVDELQRLSRELGHRPRLSDMIESGRYSVPPYYDRFGSWHEACEAAGLE